ncbi:hypothetical protein PENSTE_c006G04875 [Penicillium steckii]|uniref:NADH dehydrogenase [ubiquinone] 1 alpha subcomplex subunit 1 n=1 Tax=Penicillium steckii TaxID=303698 RepID=A0A1V6TGA0_9EURO|nr:hypothetical protein PENSTE_c006G04875 [Penicillium steckii]
MPVPFEALLPWGIITAMFGVTGVGLYYTKKLGNDGKKARWNRDLWDRWQSVTSVLPDHSEDNPVIHKRRLGLS